MASNRSLVLGANGFIGTRLVKRLAAEGREVVAVDILPPRTIVPGVQYETFDIRGPIDARLGEGVGVLYNLAAVHRTPGHPDNEYYDTNVLGAFNATELAERCSIPLIVFTSSISVYGPSEDLIAEESPLRPTSSYGRSKRMAELIHLRWVRADAGRRLVTVRPGVVFGPGERGNYSHLSKALRGGYFVYPARRDTVKSGGYVDELLATLDFATSRTDREIVFNFAYPDASSTEDIVKTFNAVCDYSRSPLTIPLTPMLAAAGGFEVLAALGLKTPIHRERIMKLVKSTRIAPAWLMGQGYVFKTDLKAALTSWRDETNGRFA